MMPIDPAHRIAWASHALKATGKVFRSIFAIGVVASYAVSATAPVSAQPVLPTGAQVVQGSASVLQTGKQLQVTNTPGTIINWQSFGIAPGHSTYFQQQSANSSVLNQVVTNNPSQIFGTLGSNGRVILVNPSGIVVGAGAVVDTAGFTASTLGLVESNAALSRLRLSASGQSAGSLQVDGIIRSSQGDIILIAPSVHIGTAGVVKAADGSVMLAAGQQVLLTGRGLDGIALKLQAPSDQAVNLGRLEGDAVGLFASRLRNTGVIQANTAELVGGKVVLRAVDTVQVSGVVSVAGTGASGRGGVVIIEGRDVLLQSATVDASGTGGGGTVLVGGGWQGRDARVANSQNTVVDSASSINVSGVGNANAGTAVVWSDRNTAYSGQIDARGGALGGNGGQVEVSGKENLGFDGRVRVDAPRGVGGSILLDPKNIDITTGGLPATSLTFAQFGTTTQSIAAGTLESLLNSLAGGTLTLQATNDINVSAPLTFSSTTGNFNLEAGRSVNINSAIGYGTGNTANFTITANSVGATPTLPFRDPGVGGIAMGANGSIDMGGGGTLRLLVGNGAGGGGAVSLASISNLQTLIVDNTAVGGSSTGGIYGGPTAQFVGGISERVFLRTSLGSVGTTSQAITINAPLVSVSAVSGSVYLTSDSSIFLGPAAELGGAAANVRDTLSLNSSGTNIGARGAQFGSSSVTAGQLIFNGSPLVIYSNSSNSTASLQVSVGGLSGPQALEISSLATVTTSLVVGTGGFGIGGALNIYGSGISVAAPASVVSASDVQVASLLLAGAKSGAKLDVNSPVFGLRVLNPVGTTTVTVQGGVGNNAAATVYARGVEIGTVTSAITVVKVLGGAGVNSTAVLSTVGGNVDVYGAQLVQIGDGTAQTSSPSRITSSGSVTILRPASGSSQVLVSGGSATFSEMTAQQTVRISADQVALTGGSGAITSARISASGPINITATTGVSLTGGAGATATAVIVSGSSTNVIGPLALQGGAGTGSMALVSTTGNITVTGGVTFNTAAAGTGSHALIYAGGNGVAFTIAGGYTPTLAVTASPTAAALSGVIVPPADVGISVALPASGIQGSTVSATVTFSNPGLISATFTPTLVVNGLTTTFAPVTLAPNSTVTSVTSVLVGAGTTTVAASTGKTSWPELNLANNTNTAFISAGAVADVRISLTATPNGTPGQVITVTVTVTNTGPNAAAGTTATIALPNGTTQTITIGTVPSGGTTTASFAYTIPAGSSTVQTFNAAVTTTTGDSNPANNTNSAAVSVNPVSDVVAFVVLPPNLIAGSTATATVTFVNSGPSTAQNFTATVVANGFTQTFTATSIVSGGSFTALATVAVGTTVNTVSAGGFSTTPDSTPGNNTVTTGSVSLVSDIRSAVTLPASAIAGTTVSAVVTFTNLGSATTTFTPIIATPSGSQSLAPVTLAPAGVFTSTTAVLVGTTTTLVTGNVGGNSVPQINTTNDFSSATLAPLVSDIRSAVTLPASAIAGTTVSAVVTYTNLGGATTTFTPIIATPSGSQSLAPVTLAPAGVFTSTTAVLVGTTTTLVTGNVGGNSVPQTSTANYFSSAAVTPLLSDISTAVSLPSAATANTTVTGLVTFTNVGAATTTFTPLVVLAGTTQTLSPVTLVPGGTFTSSVTVLVGTTGNSLAGGVASTSVPDANAANNSSGAVVTGFVPPPEPPPQPPPVVTPTGVVTPPVVSTPTVVVTPPIVSTPTVVVTPSVVITPTVVVTPPVVSTPTVVVTPPVVSTPTVVVTQPVVITPTVVVTLPIASTPTVVVDQPVVPTPPSVMQTATAPLQLEAFLQQSLVAFGDNRQTALSLFTPVEANPPQKAKLRDLPICPRN